MHGATAVKPMRARGKTPLTILRYALLIAVIAVLFFPLYWTFITALTKSGEMLNTQSVIPALSNLTFDNFRSIIDKQPMALWFGNSLLVTVCSTCIALFISALAAYAMSRYKYKGIGALGFFLLIIRMLPETLLIVPLYIMFSKVGLINHHLSLIISNITFVIPFATWMMKGYFDTVPISIEEAAMIDGCTLTQSLRKVVIPLVTPGLAATATYSAILNWSEFLFARTFLTNPAKWTITVGINSLIGEHMINWGEIMAAAAISIIPIAFVFIFFERYMVAGVTSGAVKG